jgi:hypothetical protein
LMIDEEKEKWESVEVLEGLPTTLTTTYLSTRNFSSLGAYHMSSP